MITIIQKYVPTNLTLQEFILYKINRFLYKNIRNFLPEIQLKHFIFLGLFCLKWKLKDFGKSQV